MTGTTRGRRPADVVGSDPPSAPDPSSASDGSTTGAIVFTDIVGFTELTDLHGDDAALALVERQTALARAALPSSGRIVKELGDGLLLWFDDPVAALCTALDLQDHLAGSARDDDLPLWVRIGIHWGTPRRRGDDVIGRDVNLASRVMDLAGPGEVLCTGALVDAVGGPRAVLGVTIDFVGATYVKGLADPVPVHRAGRG